MSIIGKIQNKPYQTRVKFFWFGLIIATIVLVLVWGAFALAPKSQESSQKSMLAQVKEWFAAVPARTENTGLENSAKLPITILKTSNTINGQVLILFTVKNESNYILTLLNEAENTTPKITLDNKDLLPVSVATSDGLPFPGKILSKTSLSGSMLFDNPGDKSFTLEFANLFYDSENKEKFSQTIPIIIGVTGTSNTDELQPRQ